MKKRGRPKGSVKPNKKQPKNYRLSEQETFAVKVVLDSIRHPKPIPEYERKISNIQIQMQNSPQMDIYTEKIHLINVNNLSNIFVIWEEKEGFPLILKCLVHKKTSQSYIIRINRPYYHSGAEPLPAYYDEELSCSCYKVAKKIIDKNSQCFSSYSLALAALLHKNKNKLLENLQYANDINTYDTFIQILMKHYYYNEYIEGLEFLARKFNFDYLFRLESEI